MISLAESELGRLALRGELEPVLATRRGGLCAALAWVHREPLCRVLVARRRQQRTEDRRGSDGENFIIVVSYLFFPHGNDIAHD